MDKVRSANACAAVYEALSAKAPEMETLARCGVFFFVVFVQICLSEDEVSEASGQYVLCEYCATQYCASNSTQYLELAVLVKLLRPLRWVLTCSQAPTGCVSQCQLH